MGIDRNILVIYEDVDADNFKRLQLDPDTIESVRALGPKLDLITVTESKKREKLMSQISKREHVRAVSPDAVAKIADKTEPL